MLYRPGPRFSVYVCMCCVYMCVCEDKRNINNHFLCVYSKHSDATNAVYCTEITAMNSLPTVSGLPCLIYIPTTSCASTASGRACVEWPLAWPPQTLSPSSVPGSSVQWKARQSPPSQCCRSLGPASGSAGDEEQATVLRSLSAYTRM